MPKSWIWGIGFLCFIAAVYQFEHGSPPIPNASASTTPDASASTGTNSVAPDEPHRIAAVVNSPAPPLADGPFGLKFGSVMSGDSDQPYDACSLSAALEGSLLERLSSIREALTYKALTRQVGTEQAAICAIYLNGTMAFVLVPYRSAGKYFGPASDEFEHRFGKAKLKFTHYRENVGIFGDNIQMVSLMRENWKSKVEQVELVQPFLANLVGDQVFSESGSYLLYADARRMDELSRTEAAVAAEANAREDADNRKKQDDARHAMRQF